jgi:Flp pilus assembly protein CpaB
MAMILTILEGPSGQPGNERRRYLQIGLLALALLLVAVLGFRQVQRLLTPTKEVWVASSSLPAGTTIGPENLKKMKLAESALPKGALLDARSIAGRELARAKDPGAPFVRDDFQTSEAEASAAAEMIPEGRVMATVRIPRELVPYQNLKNGDRVDLVVSGTGFGFARVVAHDAFLIGMIKQKTDAPAPTPTGRAALIPPPLQQTRVSPTVGMVVAVHPEDALPLAQAIGGGGRLQVVLHSKAEVASGQLLELPGYSPVELIAGAKRGYLTVNP